MRAPAAALAALALACARSAPSPEAPPAPPAETTCLGANLLAWLGRPRLVVGLSGSDAAAAAAPHDLRYQYLAGAIAPAGGCATCGQGAGCDASWWGCWQEDGVAPGLFAGRFIAAAKANGQVPMFTYYVVLPASGRAEGTDEVAAIDDAAFLARYLADWKLLLGKIGSERVLLHLEPDFWGYGQHLAADPHAVPARVRAAAPGDCGAFEDSLAGLARCMIAMVRWYAPNARVGLHASGWASGYDCFNGACPDAAAEGARVGAWLLAAGAGEGDLVVGDMSDRDADWYRLVRGDASHWWDETGATTPSFARVFTWSRAVAEAVGRPFLWWQTPVGNSLQDDTTAHWKDNRVEYLFDHMAEVAAAHGVGVVYGAGEGAQTSPDTDGGVLAARTRAYVGAGGVPLCP